MAEHGTDAEIDAFLAACLRQQLSGGVRANWPFALNAPSTDDGQPDQRLCAMFAARLEYHGIALLLIERGDGFAGWPPAMIDIARALAHRTAFEEQLQQPRIAAAITALAKAGVPSLVLKGAAIAHLCYDLPAARPRGDTDLLIPQDKLAAARGALQAAGWRKLAKSAIHHSQECWQIECGAGMTHTIDLHWQMSNHATLRRALPDDAFWTNRLPLSRLCRDAFCPSPELLLVHGAINQQWHQSRGFHLGDDLVHGARRLIWSADTHFLCRSFNKGQWDRLVAYCHKHDASKVVQATLHDAVAVTGLTLPSGLLERLVPEGGRSSLFEYLGKPDGLSVLKADFAASRTIAERVRLLRSSLVPTRSQLLACLIHDSREAERSAPALPLGARRGQAPSPEFFTALGSMGFSG